MTGGEAESAYGILTYAEATDLGYGGAYPQSLEQLVEDGSRNVAGYVTPG